MITLDLLETDGRFATLFSPAQGGVSEGLFASLNCGFGSGDTRRRSRATARSRSRRLGLRAERLVTCRQVHSAMAVIVEQPWRREDAPRADGMASRVPGMALGVLAADCAPVLFCDPVARVIGAAHAGWRGAFGGVIEATVAQMAALGAEPRHIRAGIGPCIGPASYEVGPEFPLPIVAEDPGARASFRPARRPGHFLFDLAGLCRAAPRPRRGRARCSGRAHDTVAEAERFFSYRRACLRGEAAYGRELSAIALVG